MCSVCRRSSTGKFSPGMCSVLMWAVLLVEGTSRKGPSRTFQRHGAGRASSETRTESRCLWPWRGPSPGKSQAPRRPVPHMRTCSASPHRSAPPRTRRPGAAGLRSCGRWGAELPVTSDVWDGVVHGVAEQGRGQPRYSNGDSGHNGQYLPSSPRPVPPCASPLFLRFPNHQKPPATLKGGAGRGGAGCALREL